jgi:hypothetical protein
MARKHARAERRNLNDTDILTILGIIDGWQGKLTYESLLDVIGAQLNHRFSRQAISAHARINSAIKNRKESLKNGGDIRQVKSVELQKALEKINRLEAENKRLTKENDDLLTQFTRWAINAHNKGLTPEYLNRALAPPDRRPTKTPEKTK